MKLHPMDKVDPDYEAIEVHANGHSKQHKNMKLLHPMDKVDPDYGAIEVRANGHSKQQYYMPRYSMRNRIAIVIT
jgi:hypothetical protein